MLIHILVRVLGIQSILDVGIPVTVHIHVDGNGLSHIFRVRITGQEGIEELLLAGGVGQGMPVRSTTSRRTS